MDEFAKKWGIIGKSLGITGILVIIRLVLDFAQMDIITLTPLLTAFIGSAIFTVAIIFTGTFADFKESEKIPGDLAASLLILFQDAGLLRATDDSLSLHLQEDVRILHEKIVASFRTSTRATGEIRRVIADMNEAIYRLVEKDAPPQYGQDTG